MGNFRDIHDRKIQCRINTSPNPLCSSTSFGVGLMASHRPWSRNFVQHRIDIYRRLKHVMAESCTDNDSCNEIRLYISQRQQRRAMDIT